MRADRSPCLGSLDAETSSTSRAPTPGEVAVTGDVRAPRTWNRSDLAALPQATVDVRYGSGKGPQKHTLSGVPLVRLLRPETLATTDAKNDLLSFYAFTDDFPGVGAIMDGVSGEIEEHGYWGSMRDRIPLSQTDWLGPDGELAASEDPTRQGRVLVRPHGNIALIRSTRQRRPH